MSSHEAKTIAELAEYLRHATLVSLADDVDSGHQLTKTQQDVISQERKLAVEQKLVNQSVEALRRLSPKTLLSIFSAVEGNVREAEFEEVKSGRIEAP